MTERIAQRRDLTNLSWFALALALASLAALAVIDGYLRGPQSPAGIVSFELCAWSRSCGSILEAWGPDSRVMAALSLGLDYLFMVAYAAAISLGLLLAVAYVPQHQKRLTTLAAWLPWVAGMSDALENYCLTQMLIRSDDAGFAWPAAVLATVKFIALGLALAWLLVAFARHRFLRHGTAPIG